MDVKLLSCRLVLPLVSCVLTTCVMPASVSHASGMGGAESTSDGGGVITAHASYEFTTVGSGGGDGGGGSGVTSSSMATISVPPTCYYKPDKTGAEAVKYLQGESAYVKNMKKEKYRGLDRYPGVESHKNDMSGMWYSIHCNVKYMHYGPDGTVSGGHDQKDKDSDEAKEVEAFYSANPEDNIWVPAGASPPPPFVSGARLSKAVWEAVKIPAPTVETNPKVGSQGATLVGMDTWVWATGETPTSVKATATAGSTSVTVTAGSSGLQLSAPDGKASCTGFGIAWHSGMPEGSSPCTISFNRSSAHLGGATPLTIKVAYSASYSASDGSSGTLPAITTTSTVNLPVAEVQALTTNHNNPRQN